MSRSKTKASITVYTYAHWECRILLLQRFFVFSQSLLLHSILNIQAHQVHSRSLWDSANEVSKIGSVLLKTFFGLRLQCRVYRCGAHAQAEHSPAAINASWSIFKKAIVEYVVTCAYAREGKKFSKQHTTILSISPSLFSLSNNTHSKSSACCQFLLVTG